MNTYKCLAVAALCAIASIANARELDLTDTGFGKQVFDNVDSLLKNARIGNKGETTLEKLTYNTETMTIYGRVKVSAKHSWGTVSYWTWNGYESKKKKLGIDVSATAYGDFSYQLGTNQISAGIRIPLGTKSVKVLGKKYEHNFGEIRLSAEQIKSAMEGDLGALAEAIPNLGAFTDVREDEYLSTLLELERIHGKGSVYLASRRFVGEVCTSKGLGIVISLIASRGSNAPQIMQRIKELAAMEAEELALWLSRRVDNLGIDAAHRIGTSVLQGEGVQIPRYHVSLKWVTIEYRRKVLVADSNVAVTPWIKENHGAFYLVVKKSPSGKDTQPSSNGYGEGSLAGDDFPNRKLEVIPPSHRPELGPNLDSVDSDFEHEPAGEPARSPEKLIPINLINHTSRRLVIVFAKPSPEYSSTHHHVSPGANTHLHGRGVSERMLGVYDQDSARLLEIRPVMLSEGTHNFEVIEDANGRIRTNWTMNP